MFCLNYFLLHFEEYKEIIGDRHTFYEKRMVQEKSTVQEKILVIVDRSHKNHLMGKKCYNFIYLTNIFHKKHPTEAKEVLLVFICLESP